MINSNQRERERDDHKKPLQFLKNKRRKKTCQELKPRRRGRRRFQTEEKTVSSWAEKKSLADKEAETLAQDIQHLHKWVNMIDTMNKEQLKQYIVHESEELEDLRSNHRRSKAKRVSKNKSPSSSGIMASIWKFHKEDDEENTVKI
ncbi:PREDICTED: uncharacterized protein LOC104813374 [Tarenaya hassleriana]|uniref:uncharacterized protein LOC104813374 n=1 Tax=Tarenaya hassleriana TaxID=28532 RepID=UPI00053C46DE|nr:PREDICTED: uncharacterized protein LOC104813374 [Tarenaya hassleriana]